MKARLRGEKILDIRIGTHMHRVREGEQRRIFFQIRCRFIGIIMECLVSAE